VGSVVAVVSLLSGCWWGQPRFSAGGTSYNPYERTLTAANAAQITELWHAPVATEGYPLVSWGDRVLYRTGGSGDVVGALDAATGGQVWELTSAGNLMHARDDVFYVDRFPDPIGCDGRPALEGWDTATGTRRPERDIHAWDDAACDGPGSLIGIGDRYVLVAGYEWRDPHFLSTLRVHDLRTGTTRRLPDLGDGSSISSVGPLDEAAEQYYVVGSAGGPTGGDQVEARSFTGEVLWAHQMFLSFPTVPVTAEGRLYVGNRYTFDYDGFDVLDTATGNELWHGNVPGEMVQPAVRRGVVFTGLATVADGRLLAYTDCGDPSCEPSWTGSGEGRISAVMAAGNLVYATSRDDGTNAGAIRIYPADGCGAATCAPLRTIALDTPNAVAIVSGGRLLIQTNDGIHAYGITTGPLTP
jgi:outer membrane protein assembly factor BamB